MDRNISFPTNKTLVNLFLEQVERTPDNIAIQFKDNFLTYKDLDERSNQLAHYLKSFGVKEESLVPICVSRSLDMVIGIIAIMKAGGAYVPIDPEYPTDRIEYIIKDTGSKTIVTESCSPLSQQTDGYNTIFLDLDREKIAKESTQLPQTNLEPHNLAYIIYTSGSTGRPKGVMIEHSNVVQLFVHD